jgi:hypothetical protein
MAQNQGKVRMSESVGKSNTIKNTEAAVKLDKTPANMSSEHPKSASGPPISSAQLYDLADWIASHYEGVVMRKEMKTAVLKSSPAIPEYDDTKIYALGDHVRFMNRTWSVKDAVGQPGHKPPTESNVTFNNTWKLVYEGGRRKTKNKRKHSRRR